MLRALIAAILVLTLITPLSAQEVVRVALLDLQAKNIDQALTTAVSDLLRVELIKAGVYEVLDRDNMAAILKEQAFQGSGCTDAACAVEMGQMLNCQKMFVGALSKIGDRFFLSIQRVDVETAKVDFAEQVEARGENRLPEAAAELVDNMISAEGKAPKKRKKRKKAEPREEREAKPLSLAISFGGGSCGNGEHNMVNTASGEGHQFDTEGSAQFITLSVRYYPRFARWLGLAPYGMFGMGEVKLRGEAMTHDIPNGPEWYHAILRVDEGDSRLDNMRTFGLMFLFDVSRPFGFQSRRLQLVTGVGATTKKARIKYEGRIERTSDGSFVSEIRELENKQKGMAGAFGLQLQVWHLEISCLLFFENNTRIFEDDHLFWEQLPSDPWANEEIMSNLDYDISLQTDTPGFVLSAGAVF